MGGCRLLTDDEIKKIIEYFDKDTKTYAFRNKMIFLLSLYTGFRVSEILSLNIKDIYQNDKILNEIHVTRSNMKKKLCSRTVQINEKVQNILQEYIDKLKVINDNPELDPEMPLFQSYKTKNKLLRRAVLNIYKEAFRCCGINSAKNRLGTHSTRKTFATKMYKKLDKNIVDLKEAMGHKNIASTSSYLEGNNKDINDALNSLDF